MNFNIDGDLLSGISWIPGDTADTITIPDGVRVIRSIGAQNPVRHLILPEGVEELMSHAFFNLPQLEEVTLPSTLRTIGHHAFFDCHNLRAIHLPDGVVSLGTYALGNCHALTQVTLPRNLTAIPDGLLLNCRSLTEVSIPGSVTSIGISSFEGCAQLQQLSLPESVTTLSRASFRGCQALTHVTLPWSLRTIPNDLLAGCTSLQQVDLPPAVEEIGMRAFHSCSSLPHIDLPDTVRIVGFMAFSECHALRHLILPAGLKELRGRAVSMTPASQDRFISLPPSIENLANDALWGRTSMSAPRSTLVLLGGAVLCGELADVAPACPGARSFKLPQQLHVVLPCADKDSLEACRSACGVRKGALKLILAPERGREVLSLLKQSGMDELVRAALLGFIHDLRSGHVGSEDSVRCYAEVWASCRHEPGIPDPVEDVVADETISTGILRLLATLIAPTHPDISAELLHVIHARPSSGAASDWDL